MQKTAFCGWPAHGGNRRMTKTLRIMKLTAFFIMASFLSVSARGWSQNVSFSGKNVPLETVFAAVEQQTGYVFLYTAPVLLSAKPVSISVNRQSLSVFLGNVFSDQPLKYRIKGKTIIVSALSAGVPPGHATPDTIAEVTAAPPPVPISGRVIDSTGAPLAGASVSLKGKKGTVLTDKDGRFSIDVIPGDIVTVSYVGYRSSAVTVNSGMATMTIMLKTAIVNMEEVSVAYNTGYQTLSRERSAGAFSKPDLQAVDNRTNSMNVLDRLDGLIPGLTVNNAPNVVPLSPTDPGKNDPLIIRGITSVNASRSPLFVVDGMAIDDISFVNPQDIADITVLKDATAASIWGARASNGVIVITTKKGSNNNVSRVSYDGFINLRGKPDLHYMPVLNSQQFIQAAKETFDPIDYPYASVSAYEGPYSVGLAPHQEILYNQAGLPQDQVNAKLDSLASINNLGQIRDLWYRNSILTNHTLSASGGSRNYAYYGSLAYTDDLNNSPGSRNNTYKLNLRQDFRIGDRASLYVITDLNNSELSSKRDITVDSRWLPYQLFRDDAGHSLDMPYMQYLSEPTRIDYQNRSRIDLNYNPLNEMNYGYTKTNNLLTRIGTGISVRLFDGLKFEGVYGYIRGNDKTTSFDSRDSYRVRSETAEFTVADAPSNIPVYYLPTTGGLYGVSNTTSRNWSVRNQLSYDRAFQGGKHQLTLLAGQEAQEQLSTTVNSEIRGYNESLQTYANIDYAKLASGVFDPVMANSYGYSTLYNNSFQSTETKTRFTSYFANMAYTFSGKYSLNGSWRIDQSNLFGKDKSAQNRPVMSGGARWVISQEKFLQNISWLHRLAIRATYGITGNSLPVAAGSSYDVLRAGSSTFYQGGTGLTISTPGNSTLSWETTATTNTGIDFLLFGGLTGSVDVYLKKTKDLLGNLALNPFSGYSIITGNSGSLENKGLEFTLSYPVLSGKHFSWRTTLLGAYNKNRVTTLVREVPLTSADELIGDNFVQGYSSFAIFAYRYAGLDNQGRPQIRLADKSLTTAYNAAQPADVAYMGSYQPVWNGGFSNDLRYKRFSLFLNITYSLGNVMRRDVNSYFTGMLPLQNVSSGGFTSGNLHSEFANRWRKPGDEAFTDIPPYIGNQSDSYTSRNVSYYINADRNIVSASFIKMRDVTLSYNVPSPLVHKMKFSDLSLRAQLSNVMLWKANKYGIDPEFQNNNSGSRTLPFGQHSLSIGIHAGF